MKNGWTIKKTKNGVQRGTLKPIKEAPQDEPKKPIYIFLHYFFDCLFPTFICCLIATTSYTPLWAFIFTPVLATVTYYYSKTHKDV